MFAKSRSEKDAEFVRLERAMCVSGLDDKEIDNYFNDMMTEKEMRPYIEGASQQGYRKGFEAGVEQGTAEGVEKGVEQGIEKGVEKGGREGGREGGRARHRESRQVFAVVRHPG